MENKSYIKCRLLCIKNDFNIENEKTVNDSIIDSDKKVIRSIIVSNISNKMCEFLTGVEFDYSDINVHCYYSKILCKGITKKRIKHSVQPIHIDLYSETFSDLGFTNANFEYVGNSEVKQYYHDVIVEFNTIENYKKYLLTLKQCAYDKLDAAVRSHEKSKKLVLNKM